MKADRPVRPEEKALKGRFVVKFAAIAIAFFVAVMTVWYLAAYLIGG